ncbi:MAG TPA: 30S ribosomal protein S8 [Candidatus Sumerlaeota bacterium]|nr:30S ribosomal protein S8 [Candidatus Sumerlaeota bacterium]HNM47425.1 30S ribosomal protein S8 [Candidatus Sumerlaeota bacterium]
MSMTDPIADMLTRVRNANTAGLDHVDVPNSKSKVAIARILKDEGFIKYYKVMRNTKQGTIRVFLKYGPNKERTLSGLDRVSRPSLRQYMRATEIPHVRGGLGITILSTSSGILTGRECRQRNIGGEILCTVW